MMKSGFALCLIGGVLLTGTVSPVLAQLDALSLTPLTPDQAEHQGLISAVDVDSRSVVVNGQAYQMDVNTRFFQAGRQGPFQMFQPTDIRSLLGERVALRVDDQGRVETLIRLQAPTSPSGS